MIAIFTPFICFSGSTPGGVSLAGLSLGVASVTCFLGKRTLLVPRSLRPMVDADLPAEERRQVDQAIAMMMSILLGFLSLLLLATAVYLWLDA